MKLKSFLQNFEKYSNIEFYKTPFNGSRVVPCRRKDRWRDGRKYSQTWRI